MARRTKLTNELTEQFLKAYSVGLTIEKCCQYAGISEACFYYWKQREGKKPYSEFFESLRKVEAQVQIVLVNDIRQDMDWRAKAWILERRYPGDWGKKDSLDVTSKGDKVENKIVVLELPNNGKYPEDNKTPAR
jgi:hypothetical protein